jgi:plasmid stabilization system protein ParE
VARLEHHPHIGRTGRVEGTRELVIFGSPYIVAYRIEPDRIDIMAVVHGARRWLEKF